MKSSLLTKTVSVIKFRREKVDTVLLTNLVPVDVLYEINSKTHVIINRLNRNFAKTVLLKNCLRTHAINLAPYESLVTTVGELPSIVQSISLQRI